MKQFAKKFFILQDAWLYGDGKNFVKTMLRLAKTHDEVTVVEDQLGSPTSASELAKMIHFLEPTENYGLFHATCEGDTNWADFTEVIFEKMGLSTKVRHVSSEEYAQMNPGTAHRPAYSILENYMLKLTGAGIFHGSLGGRHRRVSEGYPPGGYPVDYRRERKEERWTSRW